MVCHGLGGGGGRLVRASKPRLDEMHQARERKRVKVKREKKEFLRVENLAKMMMF